MLGFSKMGRFGVQNNPGWLLHVLPCTAWVATYAVYQDCATVNPIKTSYWKEESTKDCFSTQSLFFHTLTPINLCQHNYVSDPFPNKLTLVQLLFLHTLTLVIFNTLKPWLNDHHFKTAFSNDFFNEKAWMSGTNILQFVSPGTIENKSGLVQIIALHHIGDKPLQ